jgi:hypothetical protein
VSEKLTDHAKGRYRDAKGRFIKAPVLDEQTLARLRKGTIRILQEDPQPTVLSRRTLIIIDNDWWGEGRTIKEK